MERWIERFLKFFFKKPLDKYVKELHLERFQILGGQEARFKDIVLSTDYINQEENLPFLIKYGSIERITVKVPLEIELTGLYIVIAPRPEPCKPTDRGSAVPKPCNSIDEDSPTYAGVREGVGTISRILKSLLWGLPIKVENVKVRLEGSDSCLTFRLPQLSSACINGEPDQPVLSTVISFEGATFTVGTDRVEYGTGISGNVSVTLPLATGSVQNIILEASIKPIEFAVTTDELQQAVTLAGAFQSSGFQSNEEVSLDSIYDDLTRSYCCFLEDPEREEFFDTLEELDPSTSSCLLSSVQTTQASRDVQMQYTVRASIDSVTACLFLNKDHQTGLALRLGQLGGTSQLSQENSTAAFDIRDFELIQLGMSDDRDRQVSILEDCGMARSLRHADGVKMVAFKSTSATHCATSIVAEKSLDQVHICIRLQPLVLWLDMDVLSQISEAVSRLQLPAVRARQRKQRDAFKLSISLPRWRAIVSASSCEDMVVVNMEHSAEFFEYEHQTEETEAVINIFSGSLHLVGISHCNEVVSLQSDRVGKAKLELRLNQNRRADRSMAQTIWESVNAQKSSHLGESSGSDFEFTAMTNSEPGTDSYVESLDSSSARHVQVVLPFLRFDFSKVENVAVFKVLARAICLEGEDDTQTFVSLDCRQLEAVVEKVQINISTPRAVLGLNLGGDPGTFYFNVSHSEAEVLEYDQHSSSPCKVLSCNTTAIGRGDGEVENVLAGESAAGLSFTFFSWREKGDSLYTGTVKGMTLVTVGGRFGWISSITEFVQRSMEPFQTSAEESEKQRCSILLDFQDIALFYEPAADIDSRCVVAAAAFRISATEQWDFLLKDLALHIGQERCTSKTGAIRQAGYIQVARSSILGASLKPGVDGWELDFGKKLQLCVESCGDTTEAFACLVGDLQQSLAGDTRQETELPSDESPENEYQWPHEEEVTTRYCYSPEVVDDYYSTPDASSELSSNEDFETQEDWYGDFQEQDKPKGGWYVDSAARIVNSYVEAKEDPIPNAAAKVTISGLDVQWKLYGGSDWGKRQRNECMELSIRGLDVQYARFGPTEERASVLNVVLDQVEIYDQSSNAPWKTVLCYYCKSSRPRLSNQKALKLTMTVVRYSEAPAEQFRLSFALLPIHLHIDHQRHVGFLEQFFKWSSSPASKECKDETFFQACTIEDCVIRLDYVPPGHFFETLGCGSVVQLLSFKGVEFRLQEIHVSQIAGWSSLMQKVGAKWFQEMSKSKLARELAKGFGPSRPLYSVGEGVAKLILCPYKQYRKDGSWLKGIRQGAGAFLHNISVEALGVSASVASGVFQVLLHTDMALHGRDGRPNPIPQRQPRSVKEGFQQAYESMMQGLLKSLVILLGDPVKLYQREKCPKLAAASALRSTPKAVLAPASAAANAVRQGLLGIRNSLDPDKYRAYH